MEAREPAGALLLSRSDVERLLTPDACIAAVEDAFRQHALGKLPAPGLLGLHGAEGSFHVKAAFISADRPYFAAKLNANFPHNGARHGLPTIQGVVILCDAATGVPLAVRAMLDAGKPLQLIDVRARHAISRTPEIAVGATWRDPDRVPEWMGELSKTEPVVVYCVYGFHVGCRTAITLREAGFDARYMKGGHSGWKALGGQVEMQA